MKYTPGPWGIEYDTGMNDGGTIMAGEHVIVTDVYGRDTEGAEANARLIAAAPELLKVVQELLFEFDEVTDDGQRDVDSVLGHARKVIDTLYPKAEGSDD
jgi:hypothetical protein